MRTIFRNSILLSLCLLSFSVIGQGQPYFSEKWSTLGGETAMFYKNATTTDDQYNVYIAGATINLFNNHDILIQKLNNEGELLWEAVYNGNANMDDAAADVFVDDNYNVYVTGTVVNTLSNVQDLVVLKYDNNGILQWEYFYDNNATLYGIDVGTAIIGDNNGNIYVTGSSYGTSTEADYVTLCLNASNGSEVWIDRYDYIGLHDVPVKIVLQGNDLYVSGASQVTNDKWELATLLYKANDGGLLVERRSITNGTELGQKVNDITIDESGNIYLTGSVNNSNSNLNDISIFKLDDELNVIWNVQYDAYGENDQGNGIKVDSQGNVYVAGTISTMNEGSNYVLLKYNSSGILQWVREFNGLENGDDEAVQLVISNDLIFVTGLAYNSSYSSFQTLVYDTEGNLYTQIESLNINENDRPTGITVDLNGDIIVIGQTAPSSGSTYKTKTFKYSLFEKPFDPVYENGEPKYNANEVIIRFDRSVINYDAIDRKGFVAGQLDEFVKSSAVAEISEKLKTNVSRLPTYKIFRRMTTADSLSVTRLGDTIKVDDFWATLSVMFPENMDVEDVIDSLNSIISTVHYAEPNYIGKIFSIPNDDLYSIGQSGLYDPIHGINVENAWNKQVGQDYVKIGVYDSGINWRHEDFGDGSWAGSKIEGGWDYYNSMHPSTQTTPDALGHGTACAGIIGAIRNNNKGIAGIAGGDFQNNNLGAQLFSLKIAQGATTFVQHTDISSAIVDGSVSSTEGYGYGLHIQSHSWGGVYSKTLREGVKTSYINNCVFSVSSGNTYNNQAEYPASFNNNWVMKVGANNATGTRANFSTYGNSLDFIAPGTNDIYSTLDHDNNSGYNYDGNGTSFSCPHVSGVSALLYSEHNPLNNSEYPNVLAPDDIEYMLKKYATPITEDIDGGSGLPVPNQYSGYGRINAEATINHISLPYRIRHFDQTVNTSSATLHATNQSVTFPEGIPNLPMGYYVSSADVYKLQVTINHNLPQEETYIDGWVRNADCDLFGLTSTIANPHWSGVVMNNSNQNSATLTGYIYKAKIYNTIGQHVQDRWFPVDLNSNVKFGYSIYTIDDNPNVGIEELEHDLNVRLFPNPTTNELNLSFDVKTPNIYLEIFDIYGRLISTYNFNKIEEGMQQETINVSSYTAGLYLCKFVIGDKDITRKFIKQ